MNRVFVYGTLKSGGAIRGLNQFGEGAAIVGKAKTMYPDYEMSDLGAFPGVFLNGKFHIEGEVWEVDDQVMEQLDAIEGYPDFYNRQVTHTTQGKAWMYYLEGEAYKDYAGVRGDQVIEEGDTLKWQG
tara:strand:- start:478 stop:861 length:384 start_codon:yes stop_codon:yes gene_type:complete